MEGVGVSDNVFPQQRKRDSESENEEAVTPPSPATPPPEELSKKEKKKRKKEKKAQEAAESGEEQIERVCKGALPWSQRGRVCCVSLITSRISASAACSVCPQSARLSKAEEDGLECILN